LPAAFANERRKLYHIVPIRVKWQKIISRFSVEHVWHGYQPDAHPAEFDVAPIDEFGEIVLGRAAFDRLLHFVARP